MRNLFFVFLICAGSAFAQKYHCDKDTVEIRSLISNIASEDSFGRRVALAAESFVGRPADESLHTDSVYSFYVNVDSFTPLSLVNAAISAAKASEIHGGGSAAFADALRNYSCRKGDDSGFASLFYHTGDWIGDNVYRGNLTEVTNRDGARATTASLDYLSVNRDKFAALADPEVYDRVRMLEMGFRSHKIPYLPKQNVTTTEFRDGDVLILVNVKDRSDYYTIGIVKIEDDGPHLIHVDPKTQRVVKEAEPLKRYFNTVAKHFMGYRVVRG